MRSAVVLAVPLSLLVSIAIFGVGVGVADGAAATCSLKSGGNAFGACTALPQLSAQLAWSYQRAKGGELKMAFRAKPDSPGGWVCWGINPGAVPAMAGTRSLIAFRHANGTVALFTYNITEQNKGVPPKPAPIDFPVSNLSAEFNPGDGSITFFATWTLASAPATINHVWQTGAKVVGDIPQVHAFQPANLQSLGSLDLSAGTAASGAVPHQVLKNRHGIITTVGWGILLPIGIMCARYLKISKAADPAWFYLHVFIQSAGYTLGVAGWATGLKLGSYSKGVVYSIHRNVGIAVFVFGTLQVFALLLRPTKEHKFRKYWNLYHHSVGYSCVAMAIYNIFKGFQMLRPDIVYKRAYIGVLGGLGGIAVLLEIVYWIVFFRRSSHK